MKFSIKTALVLVMTSLVFVSCDDFLDINDNPNSPTEAPINGLMTRVTLESARNTSRVAGTTSFFVQQFASPNPAGSADTHDNVSYGTQWATLYGVLGDAADMINLADELNAPHYAGIGKILTAYNLSLLVSMYGDVPYSQALFAQTLNPAYDSSSDIYDEMFRLLAEGIADLAGPAGERAVSSDDYIYNGDPAAWTRVAHALRARFLNHYSKLPSYDRNAVLAAVDNAFRSSADDFQMNFFAGQGTAAENPWYRLAVNNAGLLLGGWLSEHFVNQLNGTTYGVVDPRIDFITAPATAGDRIGEFVGVRNGAGRGAAPEQNARAVLAVGSWYASEATAPLQIATYAEMKFIEAEAALTIDPARAFAAYEAGIRAHMEKLGVPQADIDAYWSNPAVSDQANFGIDKIMKEKYVATFLLPETWNDARRFDYAYTNFLLPENHNPALNGQFLRRVRYPDSEVQRNSAQMPERTMLDRIFWDTP
ncbi:MAG: SusD/RagB family nutrient-binding outer membrane lipoprotein [Bacteroidetes bacterium]|nr:SusD/RagB family nutrient-binding outer membrane lipoprotein [Bacteroidota bacterium]MCH8524596.1 SusD/RagB family nutrient-binding outer membrane lipoprotein [Balneolales bacterium]